MESWFWYANCRWEFYFDILITIIRLNINRKKWFFCVVYNHKKWFFSVCMWRNFLRSFKFLYTSISAAYFLIVFGHFQICKMSPLLHIIVTYIKENIITNYKNYIGHPETLGQAINCQCYLSKNLFAQATYCPHAKYSLKSLKL